VINRNPLKFEALKSSGTGDRKHPG